MIPTITDAAEAGPRFLRTHNIRLSVTASAWANAGKFGPLAFLKLLVERGWQTFSERWTDTNAAYALQCGTEGHQSFRKTMWQLVELGSGCPDCRAAAVQTAMVERRKREASLFGGDFLSPAYTKASKEHVYWCKHHGEFNALPGNVASGHWCGRCYRDGYLRQGHGRKQQPSFLEEGTALAQQRGGMMVSKRYAGSNTKFDLRCADGHPFRLTLAHLRKGLWCAKCSASLRERFVRAAMETWYGMPFGKARPEWLKMSFSKIPLELDVYNAKLGVAAQHHGEHHRSAKTLRQKALHKMWRVTRKRLRDIKRRDAACRERCAQQEVLLVEVAIPAEVPLTRAEPLVRAAVIEACNRSGVPLPPFFTRPVDVNAAFSQSTLAEVQGIAAAADIECLATAVPDAKSPLPCRCKVGHPFTRTASELRVGRGCPDCSKEAARLRRESASLDLVRRRLRKVDKYAKLASDEIIREDGRRCVIIQPTCVHSAYKKLVSQGDNLQCPECSSEQRNARLASEEFKAVAQPKANESRRKTMSDPARAEEIAAQRNASRSRTLRNGVRPTFVSPDGEVFTDIVSVLAFSRGAGRPCAQSLGGLWRGEVGQVQGWTAIRPTSLFDPVARVLSSAIAAAHWKDRPPVFEDGYGFRQAASHGIAAFARQHGLSKGELHKLWSGTRITPHRGWRAAANQ